MFQRLITRLVPRVTPRVDVVAKPRLWIFETGLSDLPVMYKVAKVVVLSVPVGAVGGGTAGAITGGIFVPCVFFTACRGFDMSLFDTACSTTIGLYVGSMMGGAMGFAAGGTFIFWAPPFVCFYLLGAALDIKDKYKVVRRTK